MATYPVTPAADDRLAAHIARLRAELAALEGDEPEVLTWRGHAIQLRRLMPSGYNRLVFSGSLTQCLKYWQRIKHRSVQNGRLWIEDVLEQSVVRELPGPKRRVA